MRFWQDCASALPSSEAWIMIIIIIIIMIIMIIMIIIIIETRQLQAPQSFYGFAAAT